MSATRFWTSGDNGTRGWHALFSIGRVQVGWHVYRHSNPRLPDRWVLQPFAIYDRAGGAV